MSILRTEAIFLTLMTLIPMLLSFPLRSAGRSAGRTQLLLGVRSTLLAVGANTNARQGSSRLYGGSRSRRKRMDDGSSTPLEWESFEFSETPKWDTRFDSSRTIVASNQEEIDALVTQEALEDVRTVEKMKEQQAAWKLLSPELVDKATNILLPFATEGRVERIESVLRQRTGHTRFLFENPANPSNVWACLRTIESFGIQYVDVIIQSGSYKGKAAISQKRGMRTAVGSAQWLSISNHLSTADAIKKLRDEQNCRIFASDLNPNSKDIRTIDWSDDVDDRPICIVMGNEEIGISDEMRELADETFNLPMCGFAESFNLSVATAITCAHLSAASQGEKGPLRQGDVPEHEYKCLKLKGLINSIAQRKVVEELFKRNEIVFPKELGLLYQ